MDETITIPIELDDSAKSYQIFESLKNITVSRAEIFKYGVMMWEIKERLKESDFMQSQSLIPAFEQLISTSIEFSNNNTITNLSNDDVVKKIVSQFVGVGVGIKYAHSLIEFNLNTLNKIPTPEEKGKYLDYSFIKSKNKYELETKGTVGIYDKKFITDIKDKKNEKPKIYLRFGTITHLVNENDKKSESKIVVVDDPPDESQTSVHLTDEQILSNYLIFLTYIADNTQYNKLKKNLRKNQYNKISIKKNKFFGKYLFNNSEYLGEYFDRRLIIDNINKLNLNNSTKHSLQQILNALTKQCGIFKYFIGIRSDIIDKINNGEIEQLTEISNEIEHYSNNDLIKFLDSDGVLVIKSINNSDNQIEKIFSDEVVKKRLGLYINYINHQRHECGATCRSRYKEGESCRKLTYRTNCHFHR